MRPAGLEAVPQDLTKNKLIACGLLMPACSVAVCSKWRQRCTTRHKVFTDRARHDYWKQIELFDEIYDLRCPLQIHQSVLTHDPEDNAPVQVLAWYGHGLAYKSHNSDTCVPNHSNSFQAQLIFAFCHVLHVASLVRQVFARRVFLRQHASYRATIPCTAQRRFRGS
jgi:hypothetical protein